VTAGGEAAEGGAAGLFLEVCGQTEQTQRVQVQVVRKVEATQTCLIVTAGRQSFSSSSRERQTVPDG